jgi:hypothetical protein
MANGGLNLNDTNDILIFSSAADITVKVIERLAAKAGR